MDMGFNKIHILGFCQTGLGGADLKRTGVVEINKNKIKVILEYNSRKNIYADNIIFCVARRYLRQ